MKFFRYLLVAITVLYAAWIAFPVARNFLFPPDTGQSVPSMQADRIDHSAGSGAMDSETTIPMDSIQGDTAVEAIETQNTPVVALWAGVILLYLVAALLHANGNVRAALTYALGFLADLALTYLTSGSPGFGTTDKIFDVLSTWDPRYVLTLLALVLGLMIYASRLRPKPRMMRAELD
ncbi:MULTISPECIES: hypothetical protein [Asticcacaulis]|uniref:hypothetical protein n=1 Tax=Asticcacaulis TaxID=76890 RepID=UPI001AE867DF|nr:MULTISPECIES: hypothetical protein [Asticcacaulis]MBP2160120.1 hypothetical protein [Asticcacaulis solisilvae]MDR6801165.1 hypothetical protein [Asticcacaulis sp. BE141]